MEKKDLGAEFDAQWEEMIEAEDMFNECYKNYKAYRALRPFASGHPMDAPYCRSQYDRYHRSLLPFCREDSGKAHRVIAKGVGYSDEGGCAIS